MITTAAFRDMWENHTEVGRAVLLKVDLTVPSALTVRLASRPIQTPDGFKWEDRIVDFGPVEVRSDLLSAGPDLATCDVVITRTGVSAQTPDKTFNDLFADYDWLGVAVTAYLWVEGLTSFADALPIMAQSRITGWENRVDGVVLHLKQQTTWNTWFVDPVSRKSDPDAPETSIGKGRPIWIGDRRAEGMPPPYIGFTGPQDPYGVPKVNQEKLGGGTMVSGGVIVDSGRTTGKIGILLASHQLTSFCDPNFGSNLFIRGNDFLSVVDLSTVTVTNTAAGARIDINNSSSPLRAWSGVNPVDIRRQQSTAKTPSNALDLFSMDTYAEVDSDTANGLLQLVLQSPSSLGNYNPNVTIMIAYSTKVGAVQLLLFPKNPGSPGIVHADNNVLQPTSGHTDIQVVLAAWPTPTALAEDDLYHPPDQWNFAGGTNATWDTVDIALGFTAAGTGSNNARVYFCGLVVNYAPSLNLVNAGYSVISKVRGIFHPRPGVKGPKRYFDVVQRGAVTEFTGDIFANGQGWADDGSGTYTGTPNILIAKPSDVARFLLKKYGLVSDSLIEIGGTTHGSFTAARNIRTLSGLPPGVARVFTERTNISDAISSLATENCSCWFVNRLTGKHSWFQWDQNAAENYGRRLTRDDLLGDDFQAVQESDSLIVNNVTVEYSQDDFRGKPIHTSLVGPSGSSGGRAQNGARDQMMTVVTGVNDKLDWTDGTVRVCTLTAGDYTGSTLAQQVRTKIKAAATGEYKVEYGGTVIAGYNDDLPVVNVLGTTFNLKLTAATYRIEDLILHVKTVLETGVTAGSHTWSVIWQANGYISITSNFNFKLKFSTLTATNCAGLLGFANISSDTANAVNAISTNPRWNDTFTIARPAPTLSLLTSTGANKATTAWTLLGYSQSADKTGDYMYTAQFRRGIRERTAIASKTANGEKEPITIQSQWFNSTEMANDLRDRIFDWRNDQPVRVKFSTMRMPDVERGMVFYLDGSIDTLTPYPHRGDAGSASWDGRKFMVTEVRQSAIQSWHAEVGAVEINRTVKDAASQEPTPPIPTGGYSIAGFSTSIWGG